MREMERRNTDSCKLVHAVLDTPGRLGKILLGMNRALGEIPVTVKLRTGVKEGRNNAHKLMPRIACEWGASAITLHGRTRQQRYTKLADWDYIKECVDAVRAREEEEGSAARANTRGVRAQSDEFLENRPACLVRRWYREQHC